MTQATPATNPPLVCWNCHERAQGTHFCASCGKLQQLPSSADYFALFGMPRKLWIEMNALEQKFLQLSWKLHPDNFVNATETERELSLKRSSELNDAYRVLRDPVIRVEYLLGLENMRKEGEHKQQAPPELLEEVFELNMHLEELRMQKKMGEDDPALLEEIGKAKLSLEEKYDALLNELKTEWNHWDKAVDAGTEEAQRNTVDKKIIDKMVDVLNRRNYIRNLVRDVNEAME